MGYRVVFYPNQPFINLSSKHIQGYNTQHDSPAQQNSSNHQQIKLIIIHNTQKHIKLFFKL